MNISFLKPVFDIHFQQVLLFFSLDLIFIYLYVCVCIHATCVQMPEVATEGVGFLGAGKAVEPCEACDVDARNPIRHLWKLG